VSDARGGQQRPQVFEGMGEGLRKREPHRGIGPYQFLFLKEVRAAIGGSAQDLSQGVESVFPKSDQLLLEDRGLEKR
jgi:hypothetical protein